MSSPDGRPRTRRAGRTDRDAPADPAATPQRPPWRLAADVLAIGLAAGSVALVLLSDDARWLRIAVVAALWSALLGATAVIRRAHDSAGHHDLAALRRRYTRELEREVLARQEYEANLRREVQREIAQELADARDDELDTLRDALERLRDERDAATSHREPGLRIVDGSALDPSRALPTTPTRAPAVDRAAPPDPVPASPRLEGDPGGEPATRAAALFDSSSFVDQYVRAAGHRPRR